MEGRLSRVLDRIDGRGYGWYKELRGLWEEVRGLRVGLLRVQSDPFAPPSVVGVRARWRGPRWGLSWPVALEDWICRRLHRALASRSARMGEGRSGFLGVPRPGPVMVRRGCVEASRDGSVFIRLWAGLPSRGRRILASRARELLLDRVPRAVEEALSPPFEGLEEHVYAWRLQETLRRQLGERGLVAFVGDGAVLPRRCGGCDEPLPGAVPFESPPSLRVSLEGPEGEEVTGMGVRRGVTVIAGSAFHGKSTLLEALAAGVWNHIPGDGRERVVTVRNAMYVKAEDGRFVSCVDLSPMIHDLPSGGDTSCFSTSDASGATSTAAGVQEAVEAGAELVLLDEDTAATNMLYLDERAAGLTRWHTVTPLSMLAESMREAGVSMVIVSSGSLPLLAVADTVVVMEGYRARDATPEARRLAGEYGVRVEQRPYRKPLPRLVEAVPGLVKPKVRGGRIEDKALRVPVSLEGDIHLAEEGQLNTIVAVLARRLQEARGSLVSDWLKRLEEDLEERGLPGLLAGEPGPGHAEVRALDVAYAFNRLPGLRARHPAAAEAGLPEPARHQRRRRGG